MCHGADQATIHVQGARGEIVGVLFGWPLTAPPSGERQNKMRFELSWSGHADQVYVPYQPAAGGVAG